MSDRFQFLAANPVDLPHFWARLCAEIDPPDLAFGPEWQQPRPRPGEWYFLIWDGRHPGEGRACGDGTIGLIFLREPSPTTVSFGIGLWPACRGQGLGPAACDDAYDFIFSTFPGIHKIESEVYTSNQRSLAALHGPEAGRRYRPHEEGRQRATMAIQERYYDRVLYGYTRDEWWEIAHRTGGVLG